MSHEDCDHGYSGYVSESPVLRWSLSVLVADLLGFIGGFFEVCSNFFNEQARSTAATAEHQEHGRDRKQLSEEVGYDLSKLPVTEEE